MDRVSIDFTLHVILPDPVNFSCIQYGGLVYARVCLCGRNPHLTFLNHVFNPFPAHASERRHVFALDGCRVRKKVVDFKQPPVSPPSTTAQERLMVVAIGHTDDDYEVWTHRDAAHAYGKRRGHTPH